MTAPAQFMVMVVLWIQPGQREAFEAYERQALGLAKEHGGRMAAAMTLDKSDGPDEVHVLSFPSEQAFEAFRADPRLAVLAVTRAKCIARTELAFGSPSSLATD